MHLSFNPLLRWKLAFQPLRSLVVGLVLIVQFWTMSASAAEATGVYDFPPSIDEATWVVDEAEILSRLSENKLSTQLSELAQKTGTAVRFVTMHRLDYGETIDTFTQQLFQKWFPTSATGDSQVLLVLDNVTNTTAIQAGDAAKTLLTDEIARSIAEETVAQPLRTGNRYNQAFVDASDRLFAVLSGAPDPGPPIVVENVQTEGTFATAEQTEENKSDATAWIIGFLVAATVIPMATYFLYQVNQS